MSFEPKVSIVIPVFNGSDFLDAAIESALAQSYRNTEVVVVNDGSSDGGATERVARAYGDKVRYFHKPNGGVASALNLAVREMSGDYFSWLSHDDLYCENKVEREIQALSGQDVHTTVIYCDYSVFTDDPAKDVPVRLAGVPPEQFRYWITVENVLHGCTLLVPKAAFEECGEFDERLRTTQDYDLWFRLAERYRFVHLPEVLVKARSHAGQGSLKMAAVALRECNALLSGFVAGLSRRELAMATGQAAPVAYAEIAASLWRRGFREAGWSAARMSARAWRDGSLADARRVGQALLRGGLQYSTVARVRGLLPRALRARLRGLVHRLGRSGGAARAGRGHASLRDRFTEIYRHNGFGGRLSRSGEGSDLVQTAAIRRELPRLVRELGVRTLLDAPCGDWYWMKETVLGVEHYTGVDIVAAVVENNQREFGSASTTFRCLDLAEDDLPQVDLILSRDFLVHLSFADGLRIIGNFKRSGSKYLLVTTFCDRERNADLVGEDSFWRPLNMERPPFSFPAPIALINEGCTEEGGQYRDKCLGLWRLQDLECP
jgi:hypothetical protein